MALYTVRKRLLVLVMSIQWVVVPMVSADGGLSGINATQVLRSVGGERGTIDELFPTTDVAITLKKKIPSASVPTQSLQTEIGRAHV